MINSLPPSLIEAASQVLSEALAAPAHKAMATRAANSTKNSKGLTAAEQISQHVIPLGEDRVVIPLERTITPDTRVSKHLEDNGYKIHDYEQGLAVKSDSPDRKMRIGRILQQTNAPQNIKTAYEKDPARQGIKSDPAYVVISRKPSDVAAMLTHQNWQSCQTLGGTAKFKNSSGEQQERHQEKGSYSEMVPGIVASGAHIAYLVKNPSDVDKHYGPIARTTLNPFVDPVSKHTILRPSEVYGDNWEGFHHTVKNWAEKHMPAIHPEYYRHRDVYQEGKSSIANYGPEHDEYWKNNISTYSAKNHPRADVLSSYVDSTIAEPHNNYLVQHLMQNENLPEHLSDRLVNNYSKNPAARTVLALNARSSNQVQKIMDSTLGDHRTAAILAKNVHATHAQLHDLMDMYGAAQTSVHGVRALSHNGFSPDVIRIITNHPNANDSHFAKVFELKDLNGSPEAIANGGVHNHWDSLLNIARRSNNEGIHRKVVESFHKNIGMVPHEAVHDIAEKHPNVLSSVSDHDVAEGLRRHPGNKNLMQINLARNTPTTLGAVADTSNDHDLLDKLSRHDDQDVAKKAKAHKNMLDLLARHRAEEDAFNQAHGV